MPSHIAWFNEAPVEPLPNGLKSPDPVVQRRCLAPARELENLGLKCSVFGNLHDASPVKVGQHLQKLEADIVVIGRISGPQQLDLAYEAKHRKCLVVVDFGDASDISPDLAQLAKVADHIVTATSFGAEIIAKETGLSATVIPDVTETADQAAMHTIAQMWLDCFRKLKLKPPASANTNIPTNG